MKATVWLNVGLFLEIKFVFLFSEVYVYIKRQRNKEGRQCLSRQ